MDRQIAFPYLSFRKTRGSWKTMNQRIWTFVVRLFPSTIRSCTHKISPTWWQMWAGKEGHLWAWQMDGEKPRKLQPCMKNYRQVQEASSRGGAPPEVRAQKLLAPCQTVISENMHVSNNKQNRLYLEIYVVTLKHTCMQQQLV